MSLNKLCSKSKSVDLLMGKWANEWQKIHPFGLFLAYSGKIIIVWLNI